MKKGVNQFALVRQQHQQVREAVERWVQKQGHNKCWYYPEIFKEIADILGLDILTAPQELPLLEFVEGCYRFQCDQYPILHELTKKKITVSP